ncbi:hypothetical protein CN378_12570 [Bacillus sp. AFS015802]|uniref:O-antigen ligase family protein n=1 Tax=Bacillus sp. AFS015802 TaxID=2033486 RepID=UPI000BF84325|nr:O-antigen ligase family protein [Bacillus sp. AFS015802]PFA66937.1 hypothetical protein CN378_12570 [Bacillus sp. AFS015802]
MKVKKLRYINTNDLIYILLTMYFVFFYWISGTIFPYRSIALAFIGLSVFLIQILINRQNLQTDIISLSILVISVLMIISSIINGDGQTLQNIIFFFQTVFLYLGIVSFCNNYEKLYRVIKIIFVTGFIGGPVAGLIQMITGEYIFPLPPGSPYEDNMLIKTVISSALTYNANLVALQFVTTLFLGLYLYNKINKKLLIFVCILISAVALILTFSRTSIIATILAFVIYNFFRKKKTNSLKFILQYFVLAMTSIILLFFFDDILSKVLQFNDVDYVFRLKSAENVDIRYMQWIAVVDVLFSSDIIHLLFGYGRNYINIIGSITGYNITTHNTILEQFVKNGVLSGFLIIISYYYSFKAFWKVNKTKEEFNSIFAGLIALFVSLQMISSFTLDSIMYLMIASIILKNRRGDSSINAKTR